MKEGVELNEIVMKYANRHIKRFFNLDSQVYSEEAIPRKYKGLMGLVASLVLKCDDCTKYHTIRAKEERVQAMRNLKKR